MSLFVQGKSQSQPETRPRGISRWTPGVPSIVRVRASDVSMGGPSVPTMCDFDPLRPSYELPTISLSHIAFYGFPLCAFRGLPHWKPIRFNGTSPSH